MKKGVFSGIKCGYVCNTNDGLILIVGPLFEFSCTRKSGRNILSEMGEHHSRTEELLEKDMIDLIGIGRAQLVDSDFVKKAAENS